MNIRSAAVVYDEIVICQLLFTPIFLYTIWLNRAVAIVVALYVQPNIPHVCLLQMSIRGFIWSTPTPPPPSFCVPLEQKVFNHNAIVSSPC